MTVAIALPRTSEVLSDARDGGRALRVSWHPTDDMFVLSLWRDDRCTGTFQLIRSDVPGLVTCLVDGLAQPSSTWSPVTQSVTPTLASRLLRQLAARRRSILKQSRKRH